MPRRFVPHPLATGLRTPVALLVVACALILTASMLPATAAVARCNLVPQLRDVAITQGVSSARPLVRGKDTLVKVYLSLPACARTNDTIEVRGASMSTSIGTTAIHTAAPTPSPVSPYPLVPPATSAPALDAPADVRFAVPGTVLAPTATGVFTASFSISVTTVAKSGSTTLAATNTTLRTLPGTTTPITASYDRKTNALRILAVPMGDATKPFDTQFRTEARTAVQSGMAALSRLYPVPRGVGDLRGGTGGIRYTINAGMLDLGALALLDGTGKFCGKSSNHELLRPQLAQFLRSWNAANPTATADLVVGVVDEAISQSPTQGCADGMATPNSSEAWVRAIPATATTPTSTGSLLAMEVGHALGLVPKYRSDRYSPYHSPNQRADTTAPNRGFHVGQRRFLPDPRSAMTLSGTWNDQTTLLEDADYAFLRCRLGGALTEDCTTSGGVGSATGVGADPVFVLTGRTDDTPGGTKVVESFMRGAGPRTAPDDTSNLRLVQLGPGGAVLSDLGVAVTNEETHHGDTEAEPTPHTSLFSIAFPFHTDTERIELRRGATVLYARDRTAAPVVQSVDVSPTGGGSTPGGLANWSDDAAEKDTQPALSPDGQWLAWTRGDAGTRSVYVAPTADPSARQQVPLSTVTHDAVWSRDGSMLAFVEQAGGTFQLVTVTVDTSGATASMGSPTIVRSSVNTIASPSWSPNGSRLAFLEGSNLWQIDATGASPTRLTDGGLWNSVSWSPTAGDTRVALSGQSVVPRPRRVSLASSGAQGNSSSHTPDISASGRYTAFVSNATNLTADDTTVFGDIFVYDRDLETTNRVSINAAADQTDGQSNAPSISAGGRYVAFASDASNLVPGDTNGVVDVFVHDRDSGTTERVSLTDGGAEQVGTALFSRTAVSDDGCRIAFTTRSALVAADADGAPDAYVRDRCTATTILASVHNDGSQVGGEGILNGMSDDGTTVLFSGTGAYVAADTNGASDVYVRDLSTGSNQLVSVASDGSTPGSAGPAGNLAARLSRDGAVAAFASPTSTFVSGDGNAANDVFVRDLGPGTTTRVSVHSSGTEGDGDSVAPALSPSGSLVSFTSSATNLTPSDGNGVADVFVHNRGSGSTTSVTGVADAASSASAITGVSGAQVAFASGATNLAWNDTNNTQDVFYTFTGPLAIPSSTYVAIADTAVSGTVPRPISANGTAMARWDRPDAIAFISGSDVWTMDADGTGPQQLTNAAADASPTLSASTGHYAFARTSGAPADSDIWLFQPGGTGPVEAADVTVEAADDGAEADLRADIFLTCADAEYPVAVGLEPDVIAGVATFETHVDPAVPCEDATLSTVVTDGFLTAEPPPDDSTTFTPAAGDPTAAITAPAPDMTVLQHADLSLAAVGRDAFGVPVDSDASFTWTIGGDPVGSGMALDVAPAGGSWPLGELPVSVSVEDAQGRTAAVGVTVQIVPDADNDGMPAAFENAIQTGCGGTVNGDATPTNAWDDTDADGISNIDEQHSSTGPCTAQSSYPALIDFSPDQLVVSGRGKTVTAAVTIAGRPIADVIASSVRMTVLDGVELDPALTATWTVRKGVGKATFNRARLVSILQGQGSVGRRVPLVIEGAAVGGWTFRGSDTTYVK